jgi:hypothetical protein
MKNIYTSIFAEALMRVLKNYLRKELRSADGESNQLSVATRVLNAFFGKSKDEAEFLQSNPFVLNDLISYFNFSAKHARYAVVTFRGNGKIERVGGTVRKKKEEKKKRKKKKKKSYFLFVRCFPSNMWCFRG